MSTIFRIYRNAFAGLPPSAWILTGVMLINRSGSVVLFFLTLYLTRELAFTPAEAGRVLSLYGVGSIGAAFMGGYLTDRLSAKTVQVASLICGGIGFMVLGFVKSPLAIGMTILLVALVGESLRPANATALATVCPPALRPRGFALNRLAVNLGVSIGPAIGGFLASRDYHLLFWADGLTCIAAGLVLWRWFHPPPYADEPERPSARRARAGLSPWRDGLFLAILVTVFLSGVVFTQLFSTWPLFMESVYRLSERQIGLLMGLNGVVIVLTEMPIVHALERFRRMRVVAAGTLLLFGGFAILPWGSALVYAALSVLIWTAGEILVFPLVPSVIADRTVTANRGRYMGMFNMSFASAFVAGPLLGTWIYEAMGGAVLWTAAGLLGIVVAAVHLGIDRRLRGEEEEDAAAA